MSYMHSESNSAETVEHFMTKMMLYKKLLEMNREATIEVYQKGVGVMDVYDVTNGIVYEVEPTKNQTKQLSKWKQYRVITGVNDLKIVPYKEILKNIGINKETFTVPLLWDWKKEVEKYIF